MHKNASKEYLENVNKFPNTVKIQQRELPQIENNAHNDL